MGFGGVSKEHSFFHGIFDPQHVAPLQMTQQKNIKQPSPLFSQERAPTSVPYAENQSMFLDSLVADGAWRAVYARNEKDEPIPFEIIEEEIRSVHPFEVLRLRGMLSMSYFEKSLYELPEEEVTAEKVVALADEMELQYQGGYSLRPLLSVSFQETTS
jgi:hypothetical protein